MTHNSIGAIWTGTWPAQHWLLSLITSLAASCFVPSATWGQNTAAPFVAGFERFARHGDIEPSLAGRLLLSELNCTACHESGHPTLQPKGGPILDGAGSRLQADWMRRFLLSPSTTSPGTTMPDLLKSVPPDAREKAAAALAEFLASQTMAFPEIKATGALPVPYQFWNHGQSARGRQLYHQLGCVACHAPAENHDGSPRQQSAFDRMLSQLDPEELAELGLTSAARPVASVPHADLAAKYTRRSLTHFLLAPNKVRSGGRMPDFQLQPVDAADMAAFLLPVDQESPNSDRAATADRIAEGRQLFESLRCGQCHQLTATTARHPARSLASLRLTQQPNCLGDPHRNIPYYGLDADQTKALETALSEIRTAARSTASAPDDSPERDLQLHLLQRNCYACHERNQLGGVGRHRREFFATRGNVDLGDEGRLPPSLTGVGDKLQRAWLAKVLAGQGAIRSYMTARMPVFAGIKPLPELFQASDFHSPQPEQNVFGSPDRLPAAGRTLMNAGCIQCHPLGSNRLPSVIGTDLSGVTQRVNPQWFHDFLLNPIAKKKRTRMPTFFPAGRSTNQDVLDGDVDRQIAAIWYYLKDFDTHGLPDKIVEARKRNFELTPENRPILLRAFLEGAGTHAIAVGFPEKVHFAFDAERIYPARAWRGRFLDAHGAWFDRFQPPAKPLGTDIVSLGDNIAVARLADRNQPWPTFSGAGKRRRFQGYRLNSNGIPTFVYQSDRIEIRDQLVPLQGDHLRRTLTLQPGKASESESAGETVADVWLKLLTGKSIQAQPGNMFQNDSGLSIKLTARLAERVHIRELGQHSELLVPASSLPTAENRARSIQVEYRW